MKQRLFNRALADRGDRLAFMHADPICNPAQASQEPDRAHAAGAASLPASAAFSHFTESYPLPLQGEQGEPAPGETSCVPGAVVLSDPAMILVRAIAAYEQCSNGRAVMLALADYVIKIGAGPLARAALDASEIAAVADDIATVPDHIRRGKNRFGAHGRNAASRLTCAGALDDQRAVVTALEQDASDARSGLRPEADNESGRR